MHIRSQGLCILLALMALPLAVLLAACGTSSHATTRTSTVGPVAPTLAPVAAITHTPDVAQASATVAAAVSTAPGGKQGLTTTITIHATDFAFQLDKTSVPAGPVHFVFINDSPFFPHEVMIYPQDQPKLHDLLTALAAGEDVNHDDYLQGVVGSAENVQPGQTARFDATLKPDTYELGCFITSTIGPGQMMGQYPGNGGGNGYPMGPGIVRGHPGGVGAGGYPMGLGMMGGYPNGGGAGSYAVGMRVNHYLAGMHTLLTVTAP